MEGRDDEASNFPYEECIRNTVYVRKRNRDSLLLPSSPATAKKTDDEAEAFTTEATGGERDFFSCSQSSLRRKKWTK